MILMPSLEGGSNFIVSNGKLESITFIIAMHQQGCRLQESGKQKTKKKDVLLCHSLKVFISLQS